MTDRETKFFFFSGKGGVGKTSMASATAVFYADAGLKTLIVTTDPASNLADVFEQSIGHRVTPVHGVRNLWAMEIDAAKATAEYKEAALAPYREVFPEEIVAVMEEQLNSPCTEEMASFDKFVDFIDRPQFDVVIFDTAPTGHTIRLLELPVDWSRHIRESEKGSGQTCLGPVQVLQDSRAKYDRAIAALQNPGQTTFVFVVQPEASPIKETRRAANELANIGITSSLLIINGILPAAKCDTPFFRKRRLLQEKYLQEIAVELPIPTKKVHLLSEEIKGVAYLRLLADELWGAEEEREIRPLQEPIPDVRDIAFHNDLLAVQRAWECLLPVKDLTRCIFFAGKGGVGKTSLSCITAVRLAQRGLRTLLVTTDPAAHLGEVLDRQVESEPTPVEGLNNLWAVKIDPKKTAEAYKAGILAEAETKYSEEVLAVIKEQLDSPCTEEMATFDKFLDYILITGYDCLVFDTAPTGHTLRLLELPVDWSKQLELKVSLSNEGNLLDAQTYQRYQKVINILQDPRRTTFSFVVYPENTPVLEAYRAAEELKEVGIKTRLMVANQVLPAEYCRNSFFKSRRKMQEKHLLSMREKFNAVILEMPLLDEEIKGLETLEKAGQILFGES